MEGMVRGCALVIALAGCRYGFEPVAQVGVDAPGDGRGDVPDATAPAGLDYCARIPPLAAPPVLDGVLDPGLELQTLVPVGWQSRATPPAPLPDVPVRFAIAYRPDRLYFFVDVADPDRFPARAQDPSYCGDGVELYVDHDGVFTSAPELDWPGTTQFIGRAPPDATTVKSDGGERYAQHEYAGVWQGAYAAYPRSGGYTLEAIIVAGDIGLASWSLVAGGRVGVDLSINVSTPDGAKVAVSGCPQSTRLGQFFLRIDESHIGDYAAGAPYYWPTAYCSALLDGAD
jgi:hypothetical protein